MIILAGLAQDPTGAPERDGGPDENDPRQAKPNAICHSLIQRAAPPCLFATLTIIVGGVVVLSKSPHRGRLLSAALAFVDTQYIFVSPRENADRGCAADRSNGEAPKRPSCPVQHPRTAILSATGRDVLARGEASLALHLALQPASSRSRFPPVMTADRGDWPSSDSPQLLPETSRQPAATSLVGARQVVWSRCRTTLRTCLPVSR